MPEDRKGCRRADEILGRDVEYGVFVVEVLRVELGRKGMHELAVLHSLPFLFEARDVSCFQGPPSCYTTASTSTFIVNSSLQALHLMVGRLLCDTLGPDS